MPSSLHRSRVRSAVGASPFLPARAVDPLHLRERVLAIAVAVVAATVLAGNGVAAIGSTLDEEQRALAAPRPQSFSVSATVPIEPADRDDFTVTWSPPVVYPVGAGAPQTDGFGFRASPCAGCSNDHKGVDFTPGAGTPVASIADGVVTAVGFDGTYGMRVEIEHVVEGQAVRSFSAHLQDGSVPLSVGDRVETGQIIGAVGSTGASTGAHLHFEVRIGGTPIDPVPWLVANVRTAPR
ncbi:M23 family metallopeptidase [Yonghaparkia sp. Root332]|uniref:M23 family metallopeptidase n=1 Tax=Yonghaparkia sp. Root332 TaxID=1736516 RepID=UPI0006FEF32A|nr:M23 family metallopeptidase [Yonghaparkia sp. Root332]KQV24632.1 hypothetical protein ASC54_08870 [Yonghaparkia sp. Root332]